MLANAGSNGMWESESVDGGWHCISPGFPPGGDCTFFFRWGKFDYIIGGFSGLWSKPADAPNAAYDDVARKGLDFYDGLGVPAITGISDGRFLMAGWIPIRGWGGNLVIRELLQFPDGRIGFCTVCSITLNGVLSALGGSGATDGTDGTVTLNADGAGVLGDGGEEFVGRGHGLAVDVREQRSGAESGFPARGIALDVQHGQAAGGDLRPDLPQERLRQRGGVVDVHAAPGGVGDERVRRPRAGHVAFGELGAGLQHASAAADVGSAVEHPELISAEELGLVRQRVSA